MAEVIVSKFFNNKEAAPLAYYEKHEGYTALKKAISLKPDEVIAEVKRHDLPLDVVWLPCGHYTTAEMPWKAWDAWKIATFFRKHL